MRTGQRSLVFGTLLFCAATSPSDAQSAGAPSVTASSYFGSSNQDNAWMCAADTNGNVYIAGYTQSGDFPVTSGALQTKYGDGGQDGFVAKFDNNGQLLWSTYLGGSGFDNLFGLTVDPAGDAVVRGA